MDNKITEVMKKKEFSQLPISIVQEALALNNHEVKQTRAFLRKYFGVFLTNRVLRGKGSEEELLKAHLSSKKRDYKTFYTTIKEIIGKTENIIDLGCGLNGYSYGHLTKVFGKTNYLGIEAAGQLVTQQNNYFTQQKISQATLQQANLLEEKTLMSIIRKIKGTKTIFLFQVIDALEQIRHNYSKELLLSLKKEVEYVVLTLPVESLGGRKKFAVKRTWLTTFLKEHFTILKDTEMNGERIICLKC